MHVTHFSGETFTFVNNELIIGLIMLSSSLNHSSVLNNSSSTYPPPPPLWGLEIGLEPGDRIQWVGNSVVWNSEASGGHDGGGQDNMRIITTSPVPEPGLLWITGLLALGVVLVKKKSILARLS